MKKPRNSHEQFDAIAIDEQAGAVTKPLLEDLNYFTYETTSGPDLILDQPVIRAQSGGVIVITEYAEQPLRMQLVEHETDMPNALGPATREKL